jgi:hypothetical protein
LRYCFALSTCAWQRATERGTARAPHTRAREAPAGNPQAYVQLKAGHSQGSITERYIHAAQVLFPGAAVKSESRIFGSPEEVRAEVRADVS